MDDRKLKDSVHVDARRESHLGLKPVGHIGERLRTVPIGQTPK